MSKPQIAQLNHIDGVNFSVAVTYILLNEIPQFFYGNGFIHTINNLFSIFAGHANQSRVFIVILKAFVFKMFHWGVFCTYWTTFA